MLTPKSQKNQIIHYTQKASCYSKRESKTHTNQKIIALVTTTRADWGLLSPLAIKLYKNTNFDLRIIASGTHLSIKYGNTYKEIEKDGLEIYKKVKILGNDDSREQIAKNISKTINEFTKIFNMCKIDMIVILGDRYEMLGVGIAASNLNIPIAHICGGESTQGANDEYIRHCLSKMSYIHFTTTKQYRHRVIQLGEEPSRVYNVGSLAVENIAKIKMIEQEEMAKFINADIDFMNNFCILTYHAVTLENSDSVKEIEIILESIMKCKINILATKSNADHNGAKINATLESYAKKYPNNIILKDSLGRIGYLSAVRLSKFVIGNSSSGVSEVPLLNKYTINIGDRQKGRYMPESVININITKDEIIQSIKFACNNKIPKIQNPFGIGDTSSQITQIIEKVLLNNEIDLKKKFYDIDFK